MARDGAPPVQQARVLRFRSIPKRWTFVDVVVVDSGEERGPKPGEELQLCFAAAELPVALAEGALLRFTGTEEPRRTRRGVRAYQCDKLLELTPPAIECLRCDPTASDEPAALCKYFVRGGCSDRGCPFRHAFANEHEKDTVRAARERWAAQRRAHEDADDPFSSGELTLTLTLTLNRWRQELACAEASRVRRVAAGHLWCGGAAGRHGRAGRGRRRRRARF